MSLVRAQEALDEFQAFFKAAHAYPLPSYPGLEKEMMLGMLLRKKLDPKTEDWVSQYSKPKLDGETEKTGLSEDDTRELWNAAGPTANGMLREMLDDGSFESAFTLAEQEDGIENVNTGLRRKLFDESEEEDENEDEEGDEKMTEDKAPAKPTPAPVVEAGIDTSLPPMRLETLLRFTTTGALPPQR